MLARMAKRKLWLKEVNANLIALLFWFGFRGAYLNYDRRPRATGKSAWTFSKKLHYPHGLRVEDSLVEKPT